MFSCGVSDETKRSKTNHSSAVIDGGQASKTASIKVEGLGAVISLRVSYIGRWEDHVIGTDLLAIVPYSRTCQLID